MNDKAQRIVFRDADGEIRWFSECDIQLKWSGLPSGEVADLMLLPGERWVLYSPPMMLLDEPLATVEFITEKDALDWLLLRGYDPPGCLASALSQKRVVKLSDKRSETLLHVLDEDDRNRFVVIDVMGAQVWGPLKEDGGVFDSLEQSFEWCYIDYLYRLTSGRFVRIRYKSYREIERPSFLPSAKRFSDEEAAEWLLFGWYAPPTDIAHLAATNRFQEDIANRSAAQVEVGDASEARLDTPQPLEPSDNLRAGYRDPDNYRRNVWLYELRKSGENNAAILAALAERSEYYSLETENALRSAIESIAAYHNWPVIKGKPGRPRVSNSPEKNPRGDS